MTYGKLLILCIIAPFITHCVSSTTHRDGPPKGTVDLSKVKEPIPKKEPLSHYGNPTSYVINGHRYHVLKSSEGYHQQGIASWYGTKFNGHLTSTREMYDMLAMTAASPILPLPTYVKVTNLDNHRQTIVRVNDRGPFHSGRILDLSYAAASKLGMLQKGTAHVRVDAITSSVKTHSKVAPYYVQVGAFNDYAYAQSLAKKLHTLLKCSVQVLSTQGSSDIKHTVWRVQVGPLKTLPQSKKIQEILKKAGFSHTFLVTP